MKAPIVLYNYRESAAAYSICRFLGFPRLPSGEELKSCFEQSLGRPAEAPLSADDFVGPFQDVGEVGKYAFHLCQLLNNEGVGLLSVERHNTLLERYDTLGEFSQALERHADYLENIEHKKGGLLDRLFH